MLLPVRLSTKLLTVFLIVAAFLCGSFALTDIAHAQSLSTVNAYIGADVSTDGYGLISIYIPTSPKTRLNFDQKSYVTLNLQGNYYTNNTLLPLTGANPPYPNHVYAYLQGGKTQKIKDTIRTTWSPSPNFDLVQDVYPVAFPVNGSGQIVFKWTLVNHSNQFLSAQLQFLNDVEVNTIDNPNIFTRAGYDKTDNQPSGAGWLQFPNSQYNGVPPFYGAIEKSLCTSQFPGVIGVGFTNDSLAPDPMGLMAPDQLSVVDWPTVVQGYTWGSPANPSQTSTLNMGDDAVLIEWPGNGAAPNSSTVIASGSYGVGNCMPMAIGNLAALMFKPEHIFWTPTGYQPNPFKVEAIVFDPNGSNAASNATAKQTTSGPIHIMSPLPVVSPFQSQQQPMTPPTIQTCNLSDALWTDWVDSSLINCSTDSIYSINVSIGAGGVQPPFFIVPSSGSTFSCDIAVDCQSKDIFPPKHSTHIGSNPTNCGPFRTFTWNVFDSTSRDLGIKDIQPRTDPNVTLTFSPGITGCPRLVQVTATQKDTTKASCVYFTYTDCAGNISLDTVCFSACLPPNHVDTIPPKFWLQRLYNANQPFQDSTCSFKGSDWTVTDSINNGLQTDRGIDTLIAVSSTNMTLDNIVGLPPRKTPKVSFNIQVVDSMQSGDIRIKAVDDADSVTYLTLHYCPDPDTIPPAIINFPLNLGTWTDQVLENRPWDRGIDSIKLINVNNCAPTPNGAFVTTQLDATTWSLQPHPKRCPGPDSVSFDVHIIDTFQQACFQVEAWDCAGNHTIGGVQCSSPLEDKFCPRDRITVNQSPHGITVEVFDIDSTNGQPITFNTGIDSIWFGYAHNMRLVSTTGVRGSGNPPSIHGTWTGKMSGKDSVYEKTITFTFEVADTLLQDTLPACLDWSAIDGAGNYICNSVTHWCYDLTQDTNPPILTVTNPQCTELSLYVTDSLTTDRGLYKVWLDTVHNTNFKPVDVSNINAKRLTLALSKVDSSKSALGKLFAMDVYGSQGIASIQKAHTDSVNLWMYSQNLMMGNPRSQTAPTTFTVPVYLVATDSVPLSQKNIYQYQFTFHVTGSNLIDFAGTDVTGTASAGWTVMPVPGTTITPNASRYYTVTAFGPALRSTDISNTTPLINLRFSGAATDVVQVAQIVVDTDQCEAAVVYNGGNDTTFAGPHYSVTLPSPSGTLNGVSIILKGVCTPEITNGVLPTIVSLSPTVPNPTANSASVTYTIPEEGMVMLELYDALGVRVRTLVSEVEKQGEYHLQLDSHGLSEGTYFLRLASAGKVVSRRVILAH